MNDVDAKDQELLVKRVIGQIINDQLSELKEDKQEDDNSFIFLEKSTLNILMAYMLKNTNLRTNEEGVSGDSEVILLKEIEQALAENENEFEEIITLLKEAR